ncbi:MAG: lipid II flippase MurJ, partial [Kiloniellales bacterium]|nr:lipid II flippase MurJ [Kiloniellales bacterium]
MALFRSFATVGGYTALSRVLGLLREILIAYFVGAGMVTDAFFVAFRLPNMFRRIFAEGAFNAAFVPLFAGRLEDGGEAAAKAFAEQALAVLLTSLLALTAAAMAAMPWVIHGLAPGFADDPEKFALTVELSRITFPYLLFIALAALLGGVLNSLYRFAAAA